MPAFDANQVPATSRPPSERTTAGKKLDPRRLLTSNAITALVRGSTIIVKTGRRPGLAWAENMTGVIVDIPRGGSIRVHLNDATRAGRAARVEAEDIAAWP